MCPETCVKKTKSVARLVINPSSVGKTPVRTLFQREKNVRFVNIPNSDGIRPSRFMFIASNWTRLVILPISVGIVDDNIPPPKKREVNLVSSPSSEGIVPERRFCLCHFSNNGWDCPTEEDGM